MKKYITEIIGTFFLVFVICLTAGNPIAPIAIGSILMIMVYMGGHISGAHYNPAVTLAVFIRKKIDAKEMAVYMIMQLIGATLAALSFHYMYGKTFAPAPDTSINVLKPVFIEAVFTFALASVVLNVATHSKTAGNPYYGLAIGFTVLAAAFAGGSISGGAYNPAVAFGPTLISTIFAKGSMHYMWIYLVGPFAGGAAAGAWFRMSNPEE
ncbi:MAG TPA: aquaporin [Bacteroidia bacterium]|jgi:aquaporin Z|nr:aquaporin [Bacteroidia bacterium]